MLEPVPEAKLAGSKMPRLGTVKPGQIQQNYPPREPSLTGVPAHHWWKRVSSLELAVDHLNEHVKNRVPEAKLAGSKPPLTRDCKAVPNPAKRLPIGSLV